ncbi:MAG: hypothetical protein D4R64_00945 [Porphyromonadaceae bacterium]|nr:MAG: hypothetical protein D4R64_00945 [Porphyromonadaceae bacterium]
MKRLRIFCILALVYLAGACEKHAHPPFCQLIAIPQEGTLHTNFLFTIKSCSDNENPVFSLKFRWDLDGDGNWETGFTTDREIAWKYLLPGTFKIKCETIDPSGGSVILENTVLVTDRNETPSPYLKLSLKKTSVATAVILDGSLTWDYEDNTDLLSFRWDFNSDGIWDTDFSRSAIYQHIFGQPGKTTVTMQVIDTDDASAETSKTIEVLNTDNLYSRLWDPRNNREYPIVKIGNRWWMAENLDFGEPLTKEGSPTDNDVPEMFVYQDIISNRKLYGGLYMWGEAVSYSSIEKAEGICPEGWHIPADNEWKSMETELGINQDQLESISPDRGDPAGNFLKVGGKSGFEAGLFGMLPLTRAFSGFGSTTGFWSSTQGTSGIWVRTLKVTSGGVERSLQPNNYAYSVRCIKDE